MNETLIKGQRIHNWQMANYWLFYYALFLFAFFNHKLFAQVQPMYFTYNRDLGEVFLIAVGLPKWLIAHPHWYVFLDIAVLVFPVLVMARFYWKDRFSIVLGVLFTGFLWSYFLLQSCLLHTSLQPYVPYVLLSCLFWFNSEANFKLVVRVARLVLIYVLASAAIWKIGRGAAFETSEMSNILLVQHANYLTGNCTEWICRLHFFLIEHTVLAQCLYVAAIVLELSFVVGFFTKKYDRLLLGLLLTFVFFDQLVMRIPYYAILVAWMTLWDDSEAVEE